MAKESVRKPILSNPCFLGNPSALIRSWGYEIGLYDTIRAMPAQKNKLISVYFSAMTITTTGYGDFVPLNSITRLAASIEAILGYTMFGLIIASIISLFREGSLVLDELEGELRRATRELDRTANRAAEKRRTDSRRADVYGFFSSAA